MVCGVSGAGGLRSKFQENKQLRSVASILDAKGCVQRMGHPIFRFVQESNELFWRRDSKQQNVVAGEFDGHVVGQVHLLAGPQILRVLRAVQAELGEIQMERMR